VRPIAANTLSTVDVRSPAGENVGRVVDFMLDTEARSVVYAVLAVGGVLGVGAKMLAIRPQDLRLDGRTRCLELTVDTASLDTAPGIDRVNPPETAEAALVANGSSAPPSPTSQG